MRFPAVLLMASAVLPLCGCEAPSDSDTAQQSSDGPQAVAQKAVAGVGKQGQSLKTETGIGKMISGPAVALFNTKQKVVLEIQVPPLVQMFKATEGRFPKSTEEFMSKIVQPNHLKLPELPVGVVYRFNAEKGELWTYPEAEAPAE